MFPASVSTVIAASATSASATSASATPVLTLVLLTHATEFSKNSNTGLLLPAAFADSAVVKVRRLCWSRVAPDMSLLTAIAAGKVMVLYPTPSALPLAAAFPAVMPETMPKTIPEAMTKVLSEADTSAASPATRSLSSEWSGLPPSIDTLVLLDATWQLAQKMWNQSPYLQPLPTVQLHCGTASIYRLRRNQKNTGWCTAEATVLLLQALGRYAEAQQLWQLYLRFNSAI